MVRKQKSQLRMEEKSEATQQKSQLPTKEESKSIELVSVVITFYKILKFLGMLYNNVWVGLVLLLEEFKILGT